MPGRDRIISSNTTGTRIGFVNDYSTHILTDAATRHKVLRLGHHAPSLVRQGVQVQWIAERQLWLSTGAVSPLRLR